MFLTGLTIFSAASLARRPRPVVGRAHRGARVPGVRRRFGGAGGLSILAVTFSEGQERNRALGIFGAVGGTSASVGVIASGLLTDGPGWRWVFFINIPIGIVLIGLATVVPRSPTEEQRGDGNFDVAGATTVTGGLLLLVYGLNRGAEDGWTSTTTLLLFAAAALLLASFVRIEARSRAPLVPGAAREEPHAGRRQPVGVLRRSARSSRSSSWPRC